MHKDQHWIPRSYLEAWCDDDTPEGYEPYVWLFSKDWSGFKKKAPANVIFTENNMYTKYTDHGERDLSIEHRLGRLEGDYSRVIQNKILKNERISTGERLILCEFVSAMHERTPSQRDHLKSEWGRVHSFMKNMQREFEQATPERQNAMMNIGRLTEGPSYSMQDVQRRAEQPLQEMMVPTIKAQTSILMRMNLSILYSISKARLLTSDNPCVVFDPTAIHRPPMYRGVGLGYETVEITLTVSPRHVLLLTWQPLPQYIELTRKKVEELNQRTWAYSTEFVVSNSQIDKPQWVS